MPSKNTYSFKIKCQNCDHIGETTLPKGTPIPVAGILCPNCGCEEAVKYTLTSLPFVQKDISIYPSNPWYPKPQIITWDELPINKPDHWSTEPQKFADVWCSSPCSG